MEQLVGDLADEYDTFNGLVFHVLGSIPEDGVNGVNDEIEIQGLTVKITEIKNHQVETAIISLK